MLSRGSNPIPYLPPAPPPRPVHHYVAGKLVVPEPTRACYFFRADNSHYMRFTGFRGPRAAEATALLQASGRFTASIDPKVAGTAAQMADAGYTVESLRRG